MNISTWLVLATLGGALVAGSACTQKAADDTKDSLATAVDKLNADGNRALEATKEGAAAVIDETKEAGKTAADTTKDVAQKVGDKTEELAVAAGNKANEAVSKAGEAITDGWITTKVSAAFVGETLLKGSDINVDTDNHVVTLKGTVGSDLAKARAGTIARGTEGVTRVVNQLAVT